jgi:hypothetical protein
MPQRRVAARPDATHDAVANQQQHAAKLPGGAILERTPAIKDLAASAARVFGWDEATQTNVKVNEFKITQEQLERIRALRDDSL